MDLDEQYDKIYRYCYFKLRNREIAEDITQETFLRYLERSEYHGENALQCLYTIARNLCFDEFRRIKSEELPDDLAEKFYENDTLSHIAVQKALSALSKEERELLLLRFVNGLQISVIARLYSTSRFAISRRIKTAVKRFKQELEKEEIDE